MKPISFLTILLSLTLLISLSSSAQNNFPQLGKSSVADVVKAMTTEEEGKNAGGVWISCTRFTGKSCLPPTDPADDSVKDKSRHIGSFAWRCNSVFQSSRLPTDRPVFIYSGVLMTVQDKLMRPHYPMPPCWRLHLG